MLSVITPTHNPQHLLDAYRSLTLQRGCDWEWLVLPNGTCGSLPDEITRDARVRVLPTVAADAGRVGALKRAACDAARGDAFVELDHDDLLLPGTLAKIDRAIQNGAGFVYSDAASFDGQTLAPKAYSTKTGWEAYPVSVYGRRMLASRCFEPTPRSLCEIYFSPDHVRCWSRAAYYKAGGHNRALTVGDDHELMCATYLAGEEFAHIGGCGYLYRFHKGNTVKQAQKEIQAQVAENRTKYLPGLVREWCRREGRETLELRDLVASGWHVDRDLPQGFAPAGSLGCVVFDDCLQYFRPGLVVSLMNAAYEALAPGGWVYVSVPTTQGGLAGYQHPSTRSYYNQNSFLYYTDRRYAQQCPQARCRFQAVDAGNRYPTTEHKQRQELYFSTYLCALKGQRQPGVQAI